MSIIKVHLTPKIFFAKTNPLVIWSIWAEKFLDLVESSICYALSKSRLKCCTTEFQGVWGGGCWWRLPGNQTQWRLSQFSVFARENGTKLIVPIYFGIKTSKFCFRIICFSSLESEFGFDSEDTEINFDRARSATVNSLLRALRTICNISSDDGEDFFADELLVY